jgi:NAD-dependent SIR2 family protein deacetylase
MTLLTGAFLIVIGTSLVLAPAAIWPYAIAGFMILAGMSFLVRGFSRIA